MFISIPGNPRLRYTWHSEKNCCFPKRRNLLTFWFPNFRDKNEINGTMFLKKGSYVKEYTYINAKAENSPLKQFYLPDFEHEEFEEVPMVCSRGDLVVFEGNMVHRSSANMSQETSYASVLRFFDYSKDMTLSAHENAGLQNHEDYGRFDRSLSMVSKAPPGLTPTNHSPIMRFHSLSAPTTTTRLAISTALSTK